MFFTAPQREAFCIERQKHLGMICGERVMELDRDSPSGPEKNSSVSGTKVGSPFPL